MPVTGPAVPATLRPWIGAAEQVMHAYHLPGASLAVAFEGRVVLEAGLGYAEVATKAPVEPNDRFRLASVSKPITAALIGILIRDHELSLSTRPFATVLAGLRGPGGGGPVDPRLYDITIADLLVHAGGWNIYELGYDPTLDAAAEEQALGLHRPPDCEQAIEYMLSVRLSFTPGTGTVYSNFGYCVLAETIAQVTHLSYLEAAKRLLFGPLHMTSTTLQPPNPAQLLPGEVHYYGQNVEASGPNGPYELSLDALEGAGSTISTAFDLERFLIATAGTVPRSRPFPVWPDMAIAGQPLGGVSPFPSQQHPDRRGQGTEWVFDGSLPGTSTEVGVFGPITYVMLANSRNPKDETQFGALQALARSEMSKPAGFWPKGNLLPGIVP